MRKISNIPNILRPEDVTFIIDTREQLPLSLRPFKTETASLTTGDYSVRGLEHLISVERKSLSDFVQCVGRERSRFERELQRLKGFRFGAVCVEASFGSLEAGLWNGRITPQQAMGSFLSWSANYCQFLLAGDRDGAEKAVAGFLWHASRHMHAELLGFTEAVRKPETINM